MRPWKTGAMRGRRYDATNCHSERSEESTWSVVNRPVLEILPFEALRGFVTVSCSAVWNILGRGWF